MRLDAGPHERHPRRPQAVLFRRAPASPGPDLPPPLDQRRHRLGRRLRQRPWRGTQGLAAMSHHLRVQPVGLGPAPARARTVASPAGIDHRDWQAGTAQFGDEWRLLAARRLKHHQPRADRLQPPHNCGDSRRSSGQLPLFAGGGHRHVQRGFGHSDPDDQSLWLTQTCSLVVPAPSRQPGRAGYGLSAQLALATGRAQRGAGRGARGAGRGARGAGRGARGAGRGARGATTPALLRPQGTAG